MNIVLKPVAKREQAANAVLEAIAATGRRFFFSPAHSRTGRFYLDEVEQVWYVNAMTGLQFAPIGANWAGCSVGETGRALIAALDRFIRLGEPVPFQHLKNDWGYGSAMPELIKTIMKLNVFDKEQAHAA